MLTLRALFVVALSVVAGLAVVRLFLSRIVPFFIYHPEPLKPLESDPALWGFPQAEEVRFAAADGVELHAWWFPASGPDDPAASRERDAESDPPAEPRPRGVALYLHGNAGHLAYRGEFAAALSWLGLDVLLPDYRGYGLSEGKPDEEGLYRDAEATYEMALKRSGLGAERLIVVGNSLGSAVAVELARRRPVAGLVLLSAFTSTVAVGRHAFRWLPESLLSWKTHCFDILARIGEVRAPVLVAIGDEDRLIPVEEARRVFEAAPGPKRWYVAQGAQHNDIFSHPGVWREVQRLVALTQGAP